MRRIGTITFHWATNYGAVLQSYALQQAILKIGLKTEIIDYIPKRIKLIIIYNQIINHKWSDIRKEKAIKSFRKKNLLISKRKYSKNADLIKYSEQYDCVITGSDQIWNESFTLHAEKKPTLSYFLNFCNKGTKRISYAASFGSESVSQEYIDVVKPEISLFNKISIRETSGLKIIRELGVKATIVCDPTLLLDAEDYIKYIIPIENPQKVFGYIIHEKQELAESIFYNVCKSIDSSCTIEQQNYGIEEWLSRIYYSSIVVTNSFHGVVFSILFNKDFIVIPVNGADMNDRIITLLTNLKLEKRIVNTDKEEVILNSINAKIDWSIVNSKVQELKKVGQDFLNDSIL